MIRKLMGATSALAAKYHEAPMLRVKVAAGELPPVEERLPEEPKVLKPIAIAEPEIGRYGGTLRVFATDNLPWGDLLESPERGSYLLRMEMNGEIVPDILEGYEVSNDEKTFTLYLRKGMKWSDGYPFTADDFLFKYEDMIKNNMVNTWSVDEPLKAIKKIDDYTVRFEMKEPYPKFPLTLIGWRGSEWVRFAPKHYLKKWHIKYNPKADELAKKEGFNHWWEAFNHHQEVAPTGDINKPTLQPWVFKKRTSTVRVFERNPYFYAVDEAGNQLPYIDRIVSTIVDSEVYQMKVISGEADVAFANLSFDNYPLYKENEEEGGYQVVLLPGMMGSNAPYFINLNHPDPVKRKIFQDIRFRQALSLAINREEINDTVFFDQGVPRQATIPSIARYYKPEWGEKHPYAKYDPDEANRLLDEMGLTERDKDGFRKRPDGKTLLLIVEFPTGGMWTPPIAAHELVKEYWEYVGLKVLLKPEEPSLLAQRRQAGVYDILSELESFPLEFYFHMMSPGAHIERWAPKWFQWLEAKQAIKEGKQTLENLGGKLPGEEPPEEIKEFYDLQVKRAHSRYGSKEYMELCRKTFDFYAKKVVQIGTVGLVPNCYIAKKNLANVPTKILPFAENAYETSMYSAKFLFFKQ